MREAPGQVSPPPFNELAADRLREAAALLAHQDDDPFRIAAYRRAVDAVAALSLILIKLPQIRALALSTVR